MLEFKRSHLPLAELLHSPSHFSLVLPSLVPALLNPSKLTRWIAIEAWLNGQLTGLALAEIYPLNRIAQLESLVVQEDFKAQGIGKKLFSFMQEHLAHEEKMKALEWMYDQASSTALIMEKILTSLNWTPPSLFLIRYHFDAPSFDPPWIHRSFQLPPAMHFFPWKELSPEDRDRIEYLSKQGRFLPYLSPLYEEEGIDLETSVGLRSEGQLAGWSITRRPNPQTVRYSSLYIDSSLKTGGYGIPLLLQSIHRQKNLLIPSALFEINVREIDPTWRHFIQKRLRPLAIKIEGIKRAYHVFHENLST